MLEGVLEIVIPRRCQNCGHEGHWWCMKTKPLPWPSCFNCDRPYHTKPTEVCKRALPLVFVDYYHEPTLRQALYHWKYDGNWQISANWAELLAVQLSQFKQAQGLLVPIPLHWSRQLMRGYNQSAILAKQISRQIGWPVKTILRRLRRTHPQAGLSPEKRVINLKNGFLVNNLYSPGTLVWLVDDIVTSGATLREAIRTLKKAKCLVVGVIAVAKA